MATDHINSPPVTEDFELTLFDRLEMIRSILKEKSSDECYISFSGGKDSTVLHHMIDEALPDNQFRRVYCDTGIEYFAIRDFVKEMQEQDSRFEIIYPAKNIKQMLEDDGYPFKSKFHSELVHSYQLNLKKGKEPPRYVKEYISRTSTHTDRICPKKLLYQFTPEFDLKIDKKCCHRLKKEPFRKYEKETGRKLRVLGLRQQEGGVRSFHLYSGSGGCVFRDKQGNIYNFAPLAPVSDAFIDWYIERNHIKLAELYYPPYNFDRTGCRACPYNTAVGKDLLVLKELLPTEYKVSWNIWRPVFEEYQKLRYRGLQNCPDPKNDLYSQNIIQEKV